VEIGTEEADRVTDPYRWPDEVRDEVLGRLLAENAKRPGTHEKAPADEGDETTEEAVDGPAPSRLGRRLGRPTTTRRRCCRHDLLLWVAFTEGPGGAARSCVDRFSGDVLLGGR
jgi:hypothetical protein